MPYLLSKNLGQRGHVRKSDEQRVLTRAQWRQVLAAVEAHKAEFPHWQRDYAALFLSLMLGLRVGEVVLLERRHFANLEKEDIALIPRLKQGERVPVACQGVFSGQPCGRRARVAASRIGQEWICPRCSTRTVIPQPKEAPHVGVVERDPPVIEEAVVRVVTEYMANVMRPDQRYFFEGRRGQHISKSQMSRIFGTYVRLAGLSDKYSFHSLRHGRGVMLWSEFQDLVLVSKSLGHKDLKSAQIYAGLDPEKKAAYKKRLDEVAFNPSAKVINHVKTSG